MEGLNQQFNTVILVKVKFKVPMIYLMMLNKVLVI